MNDFLQNLRTGNQQSQRSGMTRKAYDHTYHSANQQYQYYNTPPGKANQSYPAEQYIPRGENDMPTSLLLHSVENLSQQIGKLAENQDHLIEVQKKTASIIERQTIAIENIIKHLELSPKKIIKK